MAKLRVNFQVEESMKKYLDEKSEEWGLSISGLMNVCLYNFKQQQESLLAMQMLPAFMDQIKALQEKEGEK